MYGVPSDLPLSGFVGAECNQIALGQFQIQFHFAGTGSILAESGWELRNSVGEVIDRSCAHGDRECYRVHGIIDVQVARYVIDPPRSFTLYFQTGHALTIFDDSEHYECFSLHLIDGDVIVV